MWRSEHIFTHRTLGTILKFSGFLFVRSLSKCTTISSESLTRVWSVVQGRNVSFEAFMLSVWWCRKCMPANTATIIPILATLAVGARPWNIHENCAFKGFVGNPHFKVYLVCANYLSLGLSWRSFHDQNYCESRVIICSNMYSILLKKFSVRYFPRILKHQFFIFFSYVHVFYLNFCSTLF